MYDEWLIECIINVPKWNRKDGGMMKLLIIGGTYFAGKALVEHLMTEKKHHITLFHRGTRECGWPEVKVIRGDRHIVEDIIRLEEESFDVVVDFCAYIPGDIEAMSKVLPDTVKQYIMISTVDVLPHGSGKVLSEDDYYETQLYGGETGAYIAGKIALEKELIEIAQNKNWTYTIIRPAMIYGPGNYAPRESIFLQWIKDAGQILYPVDADGFFQWVYVKDVAKAISKIIGNEHAGNQIYHLCNPERITYHRLVELLNLAVAKPFEAVEVTVQFLQERQIELPFPLLSSESEYYQGEKIASLGFTYTTLEAGMKETAERF